MKIKILAIFLCILMLATTSIAVGQPVEKTVKDQPQVVSNIPDENNDDPEDIFGWCFIRGWLMNKQVDGNTVEARAIRLHYVELTPQGRNSGVVTLKKVTFKETISFGRFYDFGPLGSLTYVIGFFHGGIEVN